MVRFQLMGKKKLTQWQVKIIIELKIGQRKHSSFQMGIFFFWKIINTNQ